MHTVFVPYSVMKVNPAAWLHIASKYRASVALVKSRDMHWGLMAHHQHHNHHHHSSSSDQISASAKDVNLSSLRLILVADGANPCKTKQSHQQQQPTKTLKINMVCIIWRVTCIMRRFLQRVPDQRTPLAQHLSHGRLVRDVDTLNSKVIKSVLF